MVNRLGAGFAVSGGWQLGFAATAAATPTPRATARRAGRQAEAHPTTDNAVVLGSWYASHKQFDCAVYNISGSH